MEVLLDAEGGDTGLSVVMPALLDDLRQAVEQLEWNERRTHKDVPLVVTTALLQPNSDLKTSKTRMLAVLIMPATADSVVTLHTAHLFFRQH